jgi:hypothetical protein
MLSKEAYLNLANAFHTLGSVCLVSSKTKKCRLFLTLEDTEHLLVNINYDELTTISYRDDYFKGAIFVNATSLHKTHDSVFEFFSMSSCICGISFNKADEYVNPSEFDDPNIFKSTDVAVLNLIREHVDKINIELQSLAQMMNLKIVESSFQKDETCSALLKKKTKSPYKSQDKMYGFMADVANLDEETIVMYKWNDVVFTLHILFNTNKHTEKYRIFCKHLQLEYKTMRTLCCKNLLDTHTYIKTKLQEMNVPTLFQTDSEPLVSFPEYEDVTHYRNTYPRETYTSSPDIRYNYVTHVGSKELNVFLIYFFQDAEKIDQTFLDRAICIMKEYEHILQNTILYPNGIIVYHGSTQRIHVNDEFICNTFMSTTRDMSTALDYANYKGFVYVLHIPPEFPFINFQDSLKQILLPIGTHVRVTSKVTYLSVTYVFCEVFQYDINFMNTVMDMLSNPCFSYSNLSFKDKEHAFLIKNDNLTLVPITMINGSSTFYSCKLDNIEYIIKDISRDMITTMNKSHNQVFKRIFNELLATLIYKHVYELNTFNYHIMCVNQSKNTKLSSFLIAKLSPFLIASRKVENIRYPQYSDSEENTYEKDIETVVYGFFVDCVMANWDIYNNDNFGFIEMDGKEHIIRTDVGGCLLYRSRGEQRFQFAARVPPTDHFILLSNLMKMISFAKFKMIVRKMGKTYLFDDETLRKRLKSVKTICLDFISMITEKYYIKKYTDIVTEVLDIVKYRHIYYRSHLNKVMNQLDEFVKNKDIEKQIGGMKTSRTTPQLHSKNGSSRSRLSNRSSSRILIKRPFPEQISVFTSTPQQFITMLRNRPICNMKPK